MVFNESFRIRHSLPTYLPHGNLCQLKPNENFGDILRPIVHLAKSLLVARAAATMLNYRAWKSWNFLVSTFTCTVDLACFYKQHCLVSFFAYYLIIIEKYSKIFRYKVR